MKKGQPIRVYISDSSDIKIGKEVEISSLNGVRYQTSAEFAVKGGDLKIFEIDLDDFDLNAGPYVLSVYINGKKDNRIIVIYE